MLRTLARAEKLGKTSVALLIQGEPGTGKKLLAHIIRQLSSRHNRPMIEVICAGDMDLLEDDLFGHRKGAFPGADEHRVGFFRKVDEGTLVLEEVGNLSLEIQTRLIQTARGKSRATPGRRFGISYRCQNYSHNESKFTGSYGKWDVQGRFVSLFFSFSPLSSAMRDSQRRYSFAS
jgi:DNA-binding NtrC family response regulator